MKKWYKKCPYCANDIKEGAIKCQYCWEFLESPKEKYVGDNSSCEDWILVNWRSLKDFLLWRWRICRWEYWLYQFWWRLGYFLLCIAVWFLCWLFLPDSIIDSEDFFNIVAVILYIPVVYWYIMTCVLRAHDIWHRWYYLLLLFIPLVNLFVWIELWFVKWKEWQNVFWEEPEPLNKNAKIAARVMPFALILLYLLIEAL